MKNLEYLGKVAFTELPYGFKIIIVQCLIGISVLNVLISTYTFGLVCLPVLTLAFN